MLVYLHLIRVTFLFTSDVVYLTINDFDIDI